MLVDACRVIFKAVPDQGEIQLAKIITIAVLMIASNKNTAKPNASYEVYDLLGKRISTTLSTSVTKINKTGISLLQSSDSGKIIKYLVIR